MKVIVYLSANSDPLHDYVLLAAFAGWAKMPNADFSWRRADDYKPSDVAVVFGTYKKKLPWTEHRGRVLEEQTGRGLTTVVIDSGYVKRGAGPHNYYAVGLNGLNGWADFRNQSFHPGEGKGMPDDRWKALGVEMKPWRTDDGSGTHIVVLGQVPWDASVQHVDLDQFLVDQVDYIKRAQRHWRRPLVFRRHPKAPVGSMPKIEALLPASDKTLAEDLERAFVVVTYNSNSAVDAILAGTPAIVVGEGDMLNNMCSRSIHEINSPRRGGNREQWAAGLAWAQWTPAEMREGLPWKHLFRPDD